MVSIELILVATPVAGVRIPALPCDVIEVPPATDATTPIALVAASGGSETFR
jgi:hypothetical protein